MAPYRRTERSIRKSRRAPRDRAWAVMRALPAKTFSVPDIVITAEITRGSLQKFINALEATGYVKKISGKACRIGQSSIYVLVRDTGRFRPHVQSNGVVYDRNESKEYKPAEVTDER